MRTLRLRVTTASALEAAQEVGDAPREAEALEKLGRAVALLGRHREAAAFFERALRVYQELGDQLGELRALGGWLDALSEVGREQLDAAVGRARAILARIEPADLPSPQLLGSALAAAHSGLGWILWTAGFTKTPRRNSGRRLTWRAPAAMRRRLPRRSLSSSPQAASSRRRRRLRRRWRWRSGLDGPTRRHVAQYGCVHVYGAGRLCAGDGAHGAGRLRRPSSVRTPGISPGS